MYSLCQWSFLVPLVGGRWYISPQLAVYTTYIPLIDLAYWVIIYHRSHLLREPSKQLLIMWWVNLRGACSRAHALAEECCGGAGFVVIAQWSHRWFRISLTHYLRGVLYCFQTCSSLLLMLQKSGEPIEVGSLSHYLRGVLYKPGGAWWCRISFINSSSWFLRPFLRILCSNVRM